eukprot:UN28146
MHIKDLNQIDERSKTIAEITKAVCKQPIPSESVHKTPGTWASMFEASQAPNINNHNHHSQDNNNFRNDSDINIIVLINPGDNEMNLTISTNTKLQEIRGIIAVNYPNSIVHGQAFFAGTNIKR